MELREVLEPRLTAIESLNERIKEYEVRLEKIAKENYTGAAQTGEGGRNADRADGRQNGRYPASTAGLVLTGSNADLTKSATFPQTIRTAPPQSRIPSERRKVRTHRVNSRISGLFASTCLLLRFVVISLLRFSLATTIIGKPIISGKP